MKNEYNEIFGHIKSHTSDKELYKAVLEGSRIQKGGFSMKKSVIIVAAAAAAVLGFVIFAGNYNPTPPVSGIAVADISNPPKEIPSGTYYWNGDTSNDDITIVVDGGNIRFQSDDLRAGFARIDIAELDSTLADDPERLKSQVDQDMEDWGHDNYVYTNRRFGSRTDVFMVTIKFTENPDTSGSFMFFPATNTLAWGDHKFTLVE